jgi:hypothetical protein
MFQIQGNWTIGLWSQWWNIRWMLRDPLPECPWQLEGTGGTGGKFVIARYGVGKACWQPLGRPRSGGRGEGEARGIAWWIEQVCTVNRKRRWNRKLCEQRRNILFIYRKLNRYEHCRQITFEIDRVNAEFWYFQIEAEQYAMGTTGKENVRSNN